jgi:hypothetical protein
MDGPHGDGCGPGGLDPAELAGPHSLLHPPPTHAAFGAAPPVYHAHPVAQLAVAGAGLGGYGMYYQVRD